MDNKAWAESVLSKVEKKMKAVVERNAHKVPYITDNGVYDNRDGDQISWWTNGFWGVVLWEMAALTGDSWYEDLAYEMENKLDRNLMCAEQLDHDNGFKWLLTSVYHYKKTGNQEARNRSILAAENMAGRYNLAGHFIRAWNDHVRDKEDVRGWAIIDCMMNLPLLYWASDETGDPRFRHIAKSHADRVIDAFIRPDGSACHIVEFDPETGERVKSYGGQGYGHGSSWTRGQGWAIYGFALSYIHTGEKKYLETAKRVADYFIASVPESNLVPCDFRQPAEPALEDTTATSIAACGFIEIAKATGEEKYLDAAVSLLKTLEDKRCNWDPAVDNLVEKGTVAYHNSEHERGIVYGDFYFIEALMKLAGIEYFPW